MHGRRPMSVGTGSESSVAEALLAHLGLRHYFSAVVAADHVVNHKPAPDTFLLCAERMGVAPEKCVVFEDADFGLQAAKRAGRTQLTCVAVSDALSLTSLFASSFLSATLLPGNSEVVLVAMLLAGVSHPWWLVLIATIGNSLGGVTNVILGRLFPLRKTSRWQERAAGWLKRYGAVTLLLSWAPVVGDLLCLLAGWMRISWGPVLFFLCLGKALRYIAIAAATLQGMTWWH